MEANFYSLTVIGVPLLAAPAALIWGLRKTLIVVVGICALMLVAPYVYFGIWALMEGENLWKALQAVAVSFPAAAIIVGWMLMWTAAYGAVAAGIRLGWLYLRRERA
ncbi:MAG: hypothetical protein ABJ263_14915 [Tateyamaria sp.]|uniref:hypothetical protein n=1 Tax=Tateyamaria sp. TaxID=1929288 RepID=UPI00328D1E73